MASLTKQLADTVTQVGVHSSYGAPVEVDGTTIMPVACTMYGFGAGEGSGEGSGDGEGDLAGAGEASGGGGGGVSVPVGAYVTREGRTRFEPNVIALLVVAAPFVWVAGRALARIIRALKR
ncbi:spore germination protein GerW family protein [Leucobacter chromiireducens]|uniref:spore germination protein GerW family protein n=1 Tax=Leucobacter chromiireducens TaxID=283877 RepID=UPI000F63A396|nr:spore germination protein GerW family protein [Leucobacter chromiireducens]